jgi:nitroimidazol reductase NimA-like FMN-containing flavoprotein (pyridoxamine 5'-phosphate oxidase superfamily)
MRDRAEPVDEHELVAHGRAIVDANLYMVLGTADADGRPWASPVYFAPDGYRDFYWVSRPERTHSRNIEVRPEISIVIFDSSVPISTGQGVYMTAVAQQLAGAEREAALDVYTRRTLLHGGEEWTLRDVEPPAPLRLYRATAVDQFVLSRDDNRIPVTLS